MDLVVRIIQLFLLMILLVIIPSQSFAIPLDCPNVITDPHKINLALHEAYKKFKNDNEGKIATYIPELAKVNPKYFAITIVTNNGKIYSVGDTKVPFAIESISKLFVYGLILESYSESFLIKNIGVYQTGLPFNSVLAGVVRAIKVQNPFVNYGAIQVTSLVKGKNADAKWKRVQDKLSAFSGSHLPLDKLIYASESATNYKNRALADLAKSNSKMYSNVMDALDRYTKACSLKVTSTQLATMGATLSNGGKNPFTKERLVRKIFIPRLLAIMVTTGLYDQSGYWNYTVGLPGKSGVGGGMLAIVPHHYAIAVFSPRLNAYGNSVRGIKVMQFLSKKLNLNLYQVRCNQSTK